MVNQFIRNPHCLCSVCLLCADQSEDALLSSLNVGKVNRFTYRRSNIVGDIHDRRKRKNDTDLVLTPNFNTGSTRWTGIRREGAEAGGMYEAENTARTMVETLVTNAQALDMLIIISTSIEYAID